MTGNVIDSVKESSAKGRYSDALKTIEQAESEGLVSAELLTWKARILQLVEDGGSLNEVEETLQRAIDMDKTSVPALIELGWFRLNVLNDARLASGSFGAALKMQVAGNTEALTGFLKCVREIDPSGNLEEVKTRAVAALVDHAKLNDAFR